MPAQKPGNSKQDYGTPWELIRAIEARWGKLARDLAAHDSGDNAKAPAWFGESDDYLKQEFTPDLGLPDDALCWCNPPFENIGPWAAKWAADAAKGARIIALVPASIGSEWFAAHVCCGQGRPIAAQVIALRPRIAFEGGGHQKGCVDPECLGCQTYPKDCMLLVYGFGEFSIDLEVWRWK